MTNSIPKDHDNIYSKPVDQVSPFTFDQKVVDVFPDMIGRSVPGYDLSLQLIPLFAQRFVQAGTSVYDLGSSLGAGIEAMLPFLPPATQKVIGVDNSAAMIDQARARFSTMDADVPIEVEFVEADIESVPIRNASFVIMNYTLQFIPQERRNGLSKAIFNGLTPGGLLFLSEKVIFSDLEQNQRIIDIHHDYKRMQGYSDLEISQKRDALMNVLVPETFEDHRARLIGAGFSKVEIVLSALNFMSIIAIK